MTKEEITNENSLRRANQLAGVVNSDSYKETIGKWLSDIKSEAVAQIGNLNRSEAGSDEKLWEAQSEIKIVNRIELRINSILASGQRARLKQVIKKDGEV